MNTINTISSVLIRGLEQEYGGRWTLTTSACDTDILIYRDDKGPVRVDTGPHWLSERDLISALREAAMTLVPQEIRDAIEYEACVEAFVKRIEEDSPPTPIRWDGSIPAWERHLYCPNCRERVGDWKPMSGPLAPEWWATVRERGRDPATGHKTSCRAR